MDNTKIAGPTYNATIPAVTSHAVLKFFELVQNDFQRGAHVVIRCSFAQQLLFDIEVQTADFVPTFLILEKNDISAHVCG